MNATNPAEIRRAEYLTWGSGAKTALFLQRGPSRGLPAGSCFGCCNAAGLPKRLRRLPLHRRRGIRSRDNLWIYPTVVLTLLIVVLIQCIHYWILPSGALLSRIGPAFTIMGAAILVVD
jgi:hypothetical protein